MNLLKNKVFLYGYSCFISYNVYKNIDYNINELYNNVIVNDSRMNNRDYNMAILEGIILGSVFSLITPITYTYKTIKYLENKINNK